MLNITVLTSFYYLTLVLEICIAFPSSFILLHRHQLPNTMRPLHYPITLYLNLSQGNQPKLYENIHHFLFMQSYLHLFIPSTQTIYTIFLS